MIVVVFGVALLILAELFRPWNYKDGNTSSQCSAGYHFYQNKPALKTRDELLKCFKYRQNTSSYQGFKINSVSISENFLRVLAQRVILILLTLSWVMILRKEKSWQLKVLIGVLFGIVIGIFVLWVDNVQIIGW